MVNSNSGQRQEDSFQIGDVSGSSDFHMTSKKHSVLASRFNPLAILILTFDELGLNKSIAYLPIP